MTIFHNVKGRIELNPDGGYDFVFDRCICAVPGLISQAGVIPQEKIDLLRCQNYHLGSSMLATVDIANFPGGENEVVELYFSKKKQAQQQ